MKNKARHRPKVGDVIAIPVSGTIVYGRLFRDASIGIYDYVSLRIMECATVTVKPIVAYYGFDDFEVRQGRWPIIGHVRANSESDEWCPPVYIADILHTEKYSLYYKGAMKSATAKDIAGMQEQEFLSAKGLQEQVATIFAGRIKRLRSLVNTSRRG